MASWEEVKEMEKKANEKRDPYKVKTSIGV
jgi:hypothetical protein